MNIIYRRIILTFFLFVAIFNNIYSQVLVDIKIDSLQLYIGEQTAITLDVTCDANQKPEFPKFNSSLKDGHFDQLVPGIEVIESCKPDTQILNDGSRMQISQRYIITSFDSALYYLPPMEVLIDTTHYRSKALALQVYSLDVDTLHLDKFAGIMDIEPLEFNWEDWHHTIFSIIVMVLLSILTYLSYWWLKKGNPVIPLMRRKPKLPPHQIAMQEIQRIKDERTWANEESKEYYTQLTDTLRNYIQERYGFRAMDMTSNEIIERLTGENDTEALSELSQLFQTADLVKFAKYTTPINENDANLLTAVQYINVTKQEVDPNAKTDEPLYTAEQRKTIGMKWTLRISIVLMSIAFIVILICMIIRLFDLLR